MKNYNTVEYQNKILAEKPPDEYDDDDDLEDALEEVGKLSPWLWWVFFLTSTPCIFITLQNTSYVFIGADIPYWCNIEQLHQTNWTQNQIRTIVTGVPNKSSCTAVNWNYTQLAQLNFEEAQAVTKSSPNPGIFYCEKFNYNGSSFIAEWDLVCEHAAKKPLVQTALSIGDFIGALLFGFLGSKWGRKPAFVCSSALLVVSSITSSFPTSYMLFVFTRVGIGMGGAGNNNSAFTLLTEVCNPKYRSLFGLLALIPRPISMVVLSLIANEFAYDWRVLQFAISAPTIVLLLFCLYLPESPKWLIVQGRKDEAWEVVKKATGGRRKPQVDEKLPLEMDKTIILKEEKKETKAIVSSDELATKSLYKSILTSFSTIIDLFSSSDMRLRVLISFLLRFTTSFSMIAITLNADNLRLNRFLYIGVMGCVGIFSSSVPILMLKFIGRRLCCSLLYFVGAVALLSILAIPQGNSPLLMSVVMIAMFCMVAVLSVVSLFISELFPIDVRPLAIGTCSTGSHIGSMLAPFIVALLGPRAWYAPSTICGSLALMASLLVLTLPETSDMKLSNTVKEIEDKLDFKVSIKNICLCSK